VGGGREGRGEKFYSTADNLKKGLREAGKYDQGRKPLPKIRKKKSEPPEVMGVPFKSLTNGWKEQSILGILGGGSLGWLRRRE